MGNWSDYDRSLVGRGSLTVWLSPQAIARWNARPTLRRGGQRRYSDLAIETVLTLRFFVAHQLHESELITKFPQAALELLDVAVDGTTYLGKDVKACLDEIEAVDTHLRDDPRFRKLKVEVRKQGD